MEDDISMFNGAYEDADGDDLFGDDDFDRESNPGMSTNQAQPREEIPEDVENAELSNLLKEGMTGEGEGFDLNALNDQDINFDQRDKADDAHDFGDVSDDDLPDEEEPSSTQARGPPTSFLSGIEESAADADMDDLFGSDDDVHTSFAGPKIDDGKSVNAQWRDDVDSVASEQGGEFGGTLGLLGARDDEMTEEEQRNFRLQMALFQGTADDEGIDDMDTWLKINYPDYRRDDEAPFWNKLLPSKEGKWQGKEHKKPRPIRPTKVTLDIEPDQRTLFTTPATVAIRIEPRDDLIHIATKRTVDQLDTLDDDSGSENGLPNGITMQDLELMCMDLDTLSHLGDDDDVSIPEPRIVGSDDGMFDYEDEFNNFEHPLKKRKTGMSAHDIVTIHQFEYPSFDDPEKMTARLAREVVLDLNDSKLLVEEVDQDTLKQRMRPGDKTGQMTTIKERLARRFRTSNDAAYNALQQNQKKIRGQLTNMTIDHSVPAVRLQYPYFQVKLTPRETRSWHRKPVLFKNGFAFSKIRKQKRRDFKSKPVRDAFANTIDLSIGDNSYVLFLEYSEQHPTMLSQTGMGVKIVNYYRKLDQNDTARPKTEIGDTSVLMPEDKSPFNNFGHIDPGEQTLAVYNSMYRAPIFKQADSPQDFLVVRDTTGINGQQYYLRPIDYQYVVGQELPSVTVPGTHSRMVTTASKNRLKAIAFRIARRKKSHRIRVEEVTRHFPDTNDMQNRQKMKEFMAFSKEHKEWEMRNNELIPDEDEIQKSLKPEDICLLESMQVGAQYLADSGFAEDEEDEEDEKEGQKELSMEQQLAPWKTTKNFIQATQGKAMLRLYGEGDPSGRGEAFSFIKTSMKGGFKAQGGTTNENVDKARGKGETATGGHTYNVARQQKSYDDSIRSIWDKQKAVLSSQIEPEDIEDEGVDGQQDNDLNRSRIRAIPTSSTHTPSIQRRRDDETGTSFSKRSTTSQAQKFLVISRRVWNAREEEWETKEIIESDLQVIKQYMKKKELEAGSQSIADLAPTGDPETDARHKKRLEAELAKLEKKKGRSRKKKGANAANGEAGSPSTNNNLNGGDAGSPDVNGDAPTPTQAPVSGGRQTQATQRKCANCGRVGHIKTNKKLCPLLNGEMQPDQTGPMDSAAFMGAPPPG